MMDSSIVSRKLRWFAASAGLALVPICFGLTLIDLVLPAFLITGAILAGKWPRLGRWLMWISTGLLGVLVFPFSVAVLLHPAMPVDSSDINGIIIMSGCAASVILFPLCVVTLVLDSFKASKRLNSK
jgi:hypothetical protein